MKKCVVIFIFIIILILSICTLCDYYNINNINCTLSVNNEIIKLDNQEFEINLNSFSSEFDTLIKNIDSNVDIYINDQKLSEELNLGSILISKENKIEVKLKSGFWFEKKYIINTLPSDFKDYTVEGESKFEGDYYLSTYSFEYDNNHYIFKLNEKGEIIFYKKTGMIAFDFKKTINNTGEIRYTYLEATSDNFHGLISVLPCDLVVLDEKYNEINRIQYINESSEKMPLENHTYLYLDDNHYILTSYELNIVSSNYIKENFNQDSLYILDCLIQEVKDDKVLWEFRGSDYEELYSYSKEMFIPNKYTDYLHINSIEIDKEDGNLLCSFRNIDSVLKINRENGELMWILGGNGDQFSLNSNQLFSKQHSVISLKNNTLYLFDNGNELERSRILKFLLDEENKQINYFKEYDLNLYSQMMGSIRVLDEENEVFLICNGGGQTSNFSVEEKNFKTNEIYFKFSFNDNKYMYNVNKFK